MNAREDLRAAMAEVDAYYKQRGIFQGRFGPVLGEKLLWIIHGQIPLARRSIRRVTVEHSMSDRVLVVDDYADKAALPPLFISVFAGPR